MGRRSVFRGRLKSKVTHMTEGQVKDLMRVRKAHNLPKFIGHHLWGSQLEEPIHSVSQGNRWIKRISHCLSQDAGHKTLWRDGASCWNKPDICLIFSLGLQLHAGYFKWITTWKLHEDFSFIIIISNAKCYLLKDLILAPCPGRRQDFSANKGLEALQDHRSFQKYSYIFIIVKLIELMPDVKWHFMGSFKRY